MRGRYGLTSFCPSAFDVNYGGEESDAGNSVDFAVLGGMLRYVNH